jgi:hypothetical protein
MAFTNTIGLNTYDGQATTGTGFIQPTAFKFQLDQISGVVYNCQTANIPAINYGFATVVTPNLDYAIPGDKANFGELQITFLISEDFSNYKSLYDLIRNQSKFYSSEEYYTFTRANEKAKYLQGVGGMPDGETGSNIQSLLTDATLSILGSNNMVRAQIFFRDCFPTGLEGLVFDTTNTTLDYLVGTASFKFKYYDIEII